MGVHLTLLHVPPPAAALDLPNLTATRPAALRWAQLTPRSLCGRSLARSSRAPSVVSQRGSLRRCSCPQAANANTSAYPAAPKSNPNATSTPTWAAHLDHSSRPVSAPVARAAHLPRGRTPAQPRGARRIPALTLTLAPTPQPVAPTPQAYPPRRTQPYLQALARASLVARAARLPWPHPSTTPRRAENTCPKP